jgi:hypothetical protein
MLKEIFPGVYSPGKVDLDNQNAAVLAVHPYFDKPYEITDQAAQNITAWIQKRLEDSIANLQPGDESRKQKCIDEHQKELGHHLKDYHYLNSNRLLRDSISSAEIMIRTS